jgi:hypothetical protein
LIGGSRPACCREAYQSLHQNPRFDCRCCGPRWSVWKLGLGNDRIDAARGWQSAGSGLATTESKLSLRVGQACPGRLPIVLRQVTLAFRRARQREAMPGFPRVSADCAPLGKERGRWLLAPVILGRERIPARQRQRRVLRPRQRTYPRTVSVQVCWSRAISSAGSGSSSSAMAVVVVRNATSNNFTLRQCTL